MKAAVLWELGKAPRCEEFSEPVASDGEALVRVRAAALKAVDQQLASGKHFASPRELPVICGTDGVGDVGDGTRVFFGGARRPFGAMAERTVVPRAFCFPVPKELDDATAAALPNPGVSAWLSLIHRAKVSMGETVLILGATGVTGQLAVQIAKLAGVKRVIAAGRNEASLERVRELGAERTIQLKQPKEQLKEAFAQEIADGGIDVVIDYLWGEPTEVLLAALTKKEFAIAAKQTRLLQAGESAGATIALPAAALRSTALTIMGTAGIPSIDLLKEAMEKVLTLGARDELRIQSDCVELDQIEEIWGREASAGRRTVVIPS
jgi:NADPH:quinone reductase-like Zn-dependent oxidoreductase